MRSIRYGEARPVRLKSAVVLLGLALALAACYPGEVTSISELDTVTTLFDANADWSTFQTYAMPDTIIHIVGEDQDSLPVDRTFDADILNMVRTRIEGFGYQLELDPENNPPDVVFLVTVTASENWVAWRYWDWWGYWGYWPGWGWYPPGYGPGWGWGYPCCGGIGVARYTTGTLFVDMLDPKSPFEDEEDLLIPVYWTAAMNGLLTGSGSTPQVLDRLSRVINQAFNQSPYLRVSEPTQ
jgi:hypothetical protein